jgi:hypothetical protein
VVGNAANQYKIGRYVDITNNQYQWPRYLWKY